MRRKFYNNEFKKGVGIDSTIKSIETRIRLAQFTLQKFNPGYVKYTNASEFLAFNWGLRILDER